jgi:hypothetical protein
VPDASYQSSTTLSGGTRANSTFTAPTGVAVGSFLTIFLEYEDWAAEPTTPAGWTRIAANGSTVCSAFLYYKFADAADAAASSFTITHASEWTSGIMTRYSDVDPTTPIHGTPLTANGSGSTPSCGSITTTLDNGLAVHHYATYDPSAGRTASSGWTERADISNSYQQEKLVTPAGPTGSTTQTPTGGTWASIAVVLASYVPEYRTRVRHFLPPVHRDLGRRPSRF